MDWTCLNLMLKSTIWGQVTDGRTWLCWRTLTYRRAVVLQILAFTTSFKTDRVCLIGGLLQNAGTHCERLSFHFILTFNTILIFNKPQSSSTTCSLPIVSLFMLVSAPYVALLIVSLIKLGSVEIVVLKIVCSLKRGNSRSGNGFLWYLIVAM